MTLTLGNVPQAMSLALTEGADFVCTLISQDGAWSPTAVISISVGGDTWNATLAGTEARFDVDKAAVDAAIDANPRTFRLTYTDGPADLLWGRGPVVITRA